MRLIDLTSIIAHEATLVISCVECVVVGSPSNEHVFTYSSLGAVLQGQDPFLEDRLRFFILDKCCSQIVLVGHTRCHALDYLLNRCSPNPSNGLRASLALFTGGASFKSLSKTVQERMLMEQNIFHQAKHLLEFSFIRSKVEEGSVTITGVVYDEKRKFVNKIFFNGISVNTVASAN